MSDCKRITVKLKNPNPLFEKWLTEWRDEALARNSKIYNTFNLALTSLKQYPLPLEAGRECMILKGFGKKLCQMLDKKLQEQKGSNEGTTLKEPKREYIPVYRSGAYAILLTIYKKSLEPDFKGYLTKPEIVQFGQPLCDKSFTRPDPGTFYTSWSSMKTLLDKNLVVKRSSPAKFTLTEEGKVLGRKLSNSFDNEQERLNHNNKGSSTVTTSSSNYLSPEKENSPFEIEPMDIDDVIIHDLLTPGSSPELLSSDNNVPSLPSSCSSQASSSQSEPLKRKNKTKLSPSKFLKSKSDEKLPLLSSSPLKFLKSKSDEKLPLLSSSPSKFLKSKSNEKLPLTQSDKELSSSSSQIETYIFPPDSFDIILLVDSQETAGSMNAATDPVLVELTYLNVLYEVRHLNVGDYTWICRDRNTNIELILPYIVERKRMDDLGGSIKDGRFHEQKFRLKQSGIQNVIYLIESYGSNTHVGLPISSLNQAAVNTLVHDNFDVKFTDDLKGTVQYLASLTKMLIRLFGSKTVMSCPKENLTNVCLDDDLVPLMLFQEFNKGASKTRNFTVKEMFARHLVQIKGMSVEKVMAIVERYPTPKLLMMAFEECPEGAAEKLLSTIQFGKLKKNIGPALSKVVYQLYTSEHFP